MYNKLIWKNMHLYHLKEEAVYVFSNIPEGYWSMPEKSMYYWLYNMNYKFLSLY